MLRPLVVLARLARFQHQFLSPPRGERASSEPRLFASDGRKRTPARPALGGWRIAHFQPTAFYLTSFPFGHQLASVSAEQGGTRHQIPSACHGGTADCHREPCSAFLRLTHGLFFFYLEGGKRSGGLRFPLRGRHLNSCPSYIV